MPDGGTVHTEAVTPDATATETAVRAALRISARNGCALTRDAAEQIVAAVLALNCAPLNHAPASGQTREVPVER